MACEGALRAFFNVDGLADLTQKIFDKKKEGMTLMKRRAAPELDGGSIWMMAVGAERVFFTCHADSIDQALAETRDAFPGQPVASACSIA